MSRLSVVIITFNEEENVGLCIDSVKDIADEIVVVDSFSTDRTKEVAEAKGARFIQHKFEGHIQQKNWAKGQATFDYVLSLDADEALSTDLKTSILKAEKNFSADGYTMNRLNFCCGKPIKTCGWYPDTKLRLWNRTKGEWKGLNPHDKFEMNEGMITAHLQGDILHNTYPDKQALLNQVEKFANISAEQLKSRNILFLLFKMIFSPPFRFIRNYFFKLGFTEGSVGLTICYQQSREVFLKYYRAVKLSLS
ncbi:MAG: glycosyl transferase [Bacteroidota bacterium]|nr:glycosyl transferase [Bacteroidota bacterium]